MSASAMTAAPALYGWNWPTFAGSAEALTYARRDLPELDRAVKLVPTRRVAVQAGGNLGLYPKRLAKLFGTVYTFEPAVSLFPLLCRNAPEPNILRYQAALGVDRQLVNTSQTRRDGRPNAHEGITHIDGAGPIPTLRLDDFALPICDFVQLDLEGWELYALQGAVETIRRCRPVLMLEINKSLRYVGLDPDDVRGYVLGQGYRSLWRAHSDEVFVPQESTA